MFTHKYLTKLLCLLFIFLVGNKYIIPQEELYRDVQFNLVAEPPPENYSDSDNDDNEGITATEPLCGQLVYCLI